MMGGDEGGGVGAKNSVSSAAPQEQPSFFSFFLLFNYVVQKLRFVIQE